MTATLWPLLQALLRNYLVFGWPFLILHVLLVVLALRDWIEIGKEIERLRRWRPGSLADDNPSTKVLQQFVDESERLGTQGFFVPVTDFSDRLDSIVSGKVTELYERINLFLIVGIAGTLFGVFEFSLRGAETLRIESNMSERGVILATVLSESLAKAFPVGFVGLLLMFLGQLIVPFYENRLKQAVVDATQAALRRRMEVTRGQAVTIAEAVDAFASATAPLADFQVTLAKGLEPLARELGGRLEQSLGLVRLQFDELQRSTREFGGSVTSLNQIVGGLGAKTDALGQALTGVPALLSGLTELQTRQSDSLKRFQDTLRASLEATERTVAAAQEASAAARELPREIGAAAQTALENITWEAAKTSKELAAELRLVLEEGSQLLAASSATINQQFSESMNAAYVRLGDHLSVGSGAMFASVSRQAEAMAGLIENAAGEVRDVAGAARSAVVELDAIRASVTEQLEKALETLAERVAMTWTTTTEKLGRESQSAFLQFVDSVRNETQSVRTNLEAASRAWGEVAGNATEIVRDPLKKVLDQVGDDLRKAVNDLDALIAQRYPMAVKDVTALTDGLHSLVDRVGGAQAKLDGWLGSLEQGRATIAQAHEELLEQLKAEVRTHDRSPEIVELLGEIRDGLDDRKRGAQFVTPGAGPASGGFRGPSSSAPLAAVTASPSHQPQPATPSVGIGGPSNTKSISAGQPPFNQPPRQPGKRSWLGELFRGKR